MCMCCTEESQIMMVTMMVSVMRDVMLDAVVGMIRIVVLVG